MNNEETTNLTEDTIYFWNEHAKPALSWIADRWMECYELSPGWTIGITVIGGLYALASILPDDDENPKEAAVEAGPELDNYHFTVKTPDGSHRSNHGPFKAAHIVDAKGMLAEKIGGPTGVYRRGNYVIVKATGYNSFYGTKTYV